MKTIDISKLTYEDKENPPVIELSDKGFLSISYRGKKIEGLLMFDQDKNKDRLEPELIDFCQFVISKLDEYNKKSVRRIHLFGALAVIIILLGWLT